MIETFYEAYGSHFEDIEIEMDRRNSAIPLKDLTNTNARIEPGAFIREQAIIEDGAVVMMGATINIGAVVGEGTMIDMNATSVVVLQLVKCTCRGWRSISRCD